MPLSSSEAPNDQQLPILDFYNQMQLLTDIQFVQLQTLYAKISLVLCRLWAPSSCLTLKDSGLIYQVI